MEEHEKFYQNLIFILKQFRNRPHHLSRYFIDNNAFNEEFINKISNSEQIENMTNSGHNMSATFFKDISEMAEYFNSMSSVSKPAKRSVEDITQEYNEKMEKYIREERYEEAVKLRDYMNKSGIERI